MRYLIFFMSVLISSNLLGQSFTGTSKPVNFNISSGQSGAGQSKPSSFNISSGHSSFALSSPISFSIRQTGANSVISSATSFNIGTSKNPTNETSVNRTNPTTENTNNNYIPELETNYPKYYYLIIGINDYMFNEGGLHDLAKATVDATNLQKKLTENYHFETKNSVLLLNPTRQQIIQELEKLALIITEKDNLLIFYAGHGDWDSKLKIGYWLPSDSKLTDKSNWISNSTIRDYIAGINSKHTLLITDACFSGSIFKTREINLTNFAMSNLYRLPSRKAMTSGTLTSVPDESKFMEYFLKRLSDTEGKYISARQIFYGIETAVLNNTHTVPQFGVIQDTGDEGGDFIFIKKQKK